MTCTLARAALAALLVVTLLACGATTDVRESADALDEEGTSEVSSAFTLAARCYGKMLKPTPLSGDDTQAIGLPMTLRANRRCVLGAPLVDRKIRWVIRRYELNGTVGQQELLVDWTDWPASQFRVEVPWTAGRLAGGSDLVPGRYQIYAYTINTSLYSDWLANDPYARAMSTRSDNTYLTIRDPGTWQSGAWGACSASCGGGTQTRTNTCVDGSSNPIDSRFCLTAAPSTSQTCNSQACSGGCYGFCGSENSMEGCYCDGACVHMNDCCSNYAQACPN